MRKTNAPKGLTAKIVLDGVCCPSTRVEGSAFLPSTRVEGPSSQVNVAGIYQGLFERKLFDAYEREGFPRPVHKDLQARPQACNSSDVHFRYPGFADLSVNAWFSLIATGLRDAGKFVGCWADAICGAAKKNSKKAHSHG